MTRFILLAILIVVCFSFGKTSFAEESSGDNTLTSSKERVDNYPRPVFESAEQAKEALQAHIGEINSILGKDTGIEFLDLESIHEKTYALEAAVDKFRADKAFDETLINALDEAVQALHFSSENQDLPKTQDWFIKAKKAADDLSGAPETSKTTAAILETSPEGAGTNQAPNNDTFEIIIKDHKFSPAELKVPAGKKIKLIVDNQDPTPEEFESNDFNREKIISGNSKATILIGPLKAGKYHFFGEFNMDQAKGDLIAE